MALPSITKFLRGDWPQIAARIQAMRDELFGVTPDLPAVDLSDLRVPPEVLTPILEKNRARVRGQLSREEITGHDSPFVNDAFFDDQLLEVLDSIQDKYQPEEFVGQLVQLITKFLTEGAAFRTGALQDRIGPRNANQCVTPIKQAWERTTDPDVKQVLDLLVTDLTYGGEEPWVASLDPALKEFVRQAVARQTG